MRFSLFQSGRGGRIGAARWRLKAGGPPRECSRERAAGAGHGMVSCAVFGPIWLGSSKSRCDEVRFGGEAPDSAVHRTLNQLGSINLNEKARKLIDSAELSRGEVDISHTSLQYLRHCLLRQLTRQFAGRLFIMASASRNVGSAARNLATRLLEPDTQRPLQSLLSQTFGKPVELNLVNLKRAHLNSDILASLVAQKLKDRRNTPRRVVRDVVWGAGLPTSQSQVPSQADHAAAAVKALAKDPSASSMARKKAPIGHIMHSLRLKQVSSIAVGAAGRLGKRMTANRADFKAARKGLTSKRPGFMVRDLRKNHVNTSFEAGKRRVGAFGIKVTVGHS